VARVMLFDLFGQHPSALCNQEMCNQEIVSSIGHKIIKEFVTAAAFCRPFSLSQFLRQ